MMGADPSLSLTGVRRWFLATADWISVRVGTTSVELEEFVRTNRRVADAAASSDQAAVVAAASWSHVDILHRWRPWGRTGDSVYVVSADRIEVRLGFDSKRTGPRWRRQAFGSLRRFNALHRPPRSIGVESWSNRGHYWRIWWRFPSEPRWRRVNRCCDDRLFHHCTCLAGWLGMLSLMETVFLMVYTISLVWIEKQHRKRAQILDQSTEQIYK